MKTKFGSTKHIASGQIYRSTNSKFIMIDAVNETHLSYTIIVCKPKKGRPKSHKPGAMITCLKSCITNYIGPIEFTLGDNMNPWE